MMEPYIDFEAGLSLLAGDREFYLELLSDFREKYTNYASDIRSCIASSDIQAAIKYAHTVKGAGANLALAALSGSARAIEEALSEGNIAEAETNLALYDTIYMKTLDEIGRLLD